MRLLTINMCYSDIFYFSGLGLINKDININVSPMIVMMCVRRCPLHHMMPADNIYIIDGDALVYMHHSIPYSYI